MDDQTPTSGTGIPTAPSDDARLLAALRAGDETAFAELVKKYQSAMVRLAMVYTGDRRVAEEVTQEAWLGVLRSLERFEGRSSLKTWIFTILTNRAKTRSQREGRSITFSDLADDDEPTVSPERFNPSDAPQWANHWSNEGEPASWDAIPEERLLAKETRAYIQQAIDRLPTNQREVITLRDIEGWTSGEVCNVLGLSETNQRVLLHRARSKVRRALEQYWTPQV